MNEIKYIPIFFDLGSYTHEDFRPPYGQFKRIFAFSPFFDKDKQHFDVYAVGRLSESWKQFIDWTSENSNTRKIVLIGHNVYHYECSILGEYVKSDPSKTIKWFDTVSLLRLLYRGQKHTCDDIKLYTIAKRFNLKGTNDAHLLSLIFERIISPYSPNEIYRVISETIDSKNQYLIHTVGNILREKITLVSASMDQIVYSKAPYELRTVNNCIQLFVQRENSWVNCASGLFKIESDKKLTIQFNGKSYSYQTWEDFFPISIASHEEHQWEAAKNNEEQLDLISKN